MVKNGKAKGTLLENEFKDYFEKWGYLCIRAAGSFGVDLVAVKKGCKPLIVNVKWLRKYCGPDERKDLLKVAYLADGLPILAYKDIPKGKKNGIRTLEIIYWWNTLGDKLVLAPLADCSEQVWIDFLKRIDRPVSEQFLQSVKSFSPLWYSHLTK